MKKRMISLILALLIAANFASCSKPSESTGEGETKTQETTEAPETGPQFDEFGREILYHSIPAELDFGGQEIVCIARDEKEYMIDFGVESSVAEIVNDTVFERNNKVETELGIEITLHPVESTNSTSSESVGDAIRTAVLAGDDGYDVCGVYQIYGSMLAAEGHLVNALELDYFDFEKPWWNQLFIDEISYNDKLYFLFGSMNLSVTSSLMAYYFNQAKITDYYGNYNFLYQLVYDGKWTYDKLTELVKGHYTDLNTNNKKDDSDFYGLIVKEDDPGPVTAAFDISLTEKDSDGRPQVAFYSERTVQAYEKLYNLYRNTDGVFFGPKTYDWRKAFAEGKGLFACCSLGSAETSFRNMDDGYGILPMPKFDEAQEQYYNAARDTSNLTGIVTTCDNIDAASAMLELMNYYSYIDLIPAYYEVAMKTKYLADSDSANMFDLIIENVKVDFGELFALYISGGSYTMDGIFSNKMRNLVRQKKQNLTSNWEKFENIYVTNLTELLEKFDALK